MKKLSSNIDLSSKIKNNPQLRGDIEDAQLSIDISMQLYRLRKEAKMTQSELAILSDLKQSNIARLESPGYQGYTLKILSKVIRALGAKLKIEIIKTSSTTTTRHDFLSSDRNISSLKLNNSVDNWNSIREKIYA